MLISRLMAPLTDLRMLLWRIRNKARFECDPRTFVKTWEFDAEHRCPHAEHNAANWYMSHLHQMGVDERIVKLARSKPFVELVLSFTVRAAPLPPFIMDIEVLIGSIVSTGLYALGGPILRHKAKDGLRNVVTTNADYDRLMHDPMFMYAANHFVIDCLAEHATPATLGLGLMGLAFLALDGGPPVEKPADVKTGDELLARAFPHGLAED